LTRGGPYEQTPAGGMVIALPVFAWEVSLAVWMIAKGFKSTDASPDESRTLSLNLAPA